MPTYTRTGEGPASATDIYGHQVEVVPGDSVETYKILGTGWTKTSDEPYYKLGSSQTVASPGSATGLIGFSVIRVTTADDEIIVTANAEDNPYAYNLTAGVSVDIANKREIETLFFTGSGTVTVIGID